eukprot:CAMPEP_0206185864 /NCGR_PEP_ID=MMETSP0166-20121206/2065_1 /ASSEMBLY_ACC=CAM_ASM_000260 /TAXON_ID=95228 /ORGANISM="Vannella robusta, Strain DIVA3 518/3/11/1/6" /LENGTH=410 /DNA_ID=CAMNT_0053601147 /DNA_START=144 /DNA_END=1376 /DNA_ORIENTATION=-
MVHYENSESPYIPPTSLRLTLHNLFENESRFQMGDLDDAAEALEAVLENLHSVVNTEDGEENCISHIVFGIDLMKQVTCSFCHSTSEPETSRHFIEYVYVSTLREKHAQNPKAAFETLLRASGQEIKSCPQDEGACKDKKSLVSRYLLNLPEVFALGLVWPTTNPTPQEIMSLLTLIRSVIDIRNIFTTVQKEPAPYRFRGMICFYGKHYDAYFYSDFRRQWLVFDDATVKCVGDQWEHVLARCKLGHFHPSVIFYERIPGTYKPAKPVFTKPKPKTKPSYSSMDLLTPHDSPTNTMEPATDKVLEPLRQHSVPDLLSSPNPETMVPHSPTPSPLLSPTPIQQQRQHEPHQFPAQQVQQHHPPPPPQEVHYPYPPTITNRRFIIGGIPSGYKLVYTAPNLQSNYSSFNGH